MAVPIVIQKQTPARRHERVPGEIEFRVADLYKVVHALLGWPDPDWEADISPSEFWAVTHWAYKKSDYWPERLTSLTKFVASLPTSREQYTK